MADLVGRGCGGTGGVVPDRVALGPGEMAAPQGASGGIAPAVAKLRQAQVRTEFAAAVPHRPAGRCGVGGQGDRVASDLAGVAGAEPGAHEHPGVLEAGEEVPLVTPPGHSLADRDLRERRFRQASPGNPAQPCEQGFPGWPAALLLK